MREISGAFFEASIVTSLPLGIVRGGLVAVLLLR
jgi:hypothetical protein